MSVRHGMRSRFYKAIQAQAHRLLARYISSGHIPKASGQCADCGTEEDLCYDHRDYSEALTVCVVCHSCNGLRGAAWISFFDLGSMQWIRYREHSGVSSNDPLKAYREANGLSQEELAKKLGISRQMVGFLENGEREFTVEMALKMEDALGIARETTLPQFFRKAAA